MSELPERLAEIVEDFSLCVGQEKLEYLLEFAEKLPPVPDTIDTSETAGDPVHECMSPVVIYPEWQDGKIFFHFDIPEEAPHSARLRLFAARGYWLDNARGCEKIPWSFTWAWVCSRCLPGSA